MGVRQGIEPSTLMLGGDSATHPATVTSTAEHQTNVLRRYSIFFRWLEVKTELSGLPSGFFIGCEFRTGAKDDPAADIFILSSRYTLGVGIRSRSSLCLDVGVSPHLLSASVEPSCTSRTMRSSSRNLHWVLDSTAAVFTERSGARDGGNLIIR